MLLVSAHQAAYMAWLGYFHKILLADKFVIMDDVQFEKNSFINRNSILQNGQPVMLTIPVSTKHYKRKGIKDIKVADLKWQNKHLKSISQSYAKAPFFEEIFAHVEVVLAINSAFLIDYIDAFLRFCLKIMGVKTEVIKASELNIKSKKLGYVMELTDKLGGDAFLFGAEGRSYADLNAFSSHSVKVFFQSYHYPSYTQFSKTFVPNLSILDLLFNEPVAKIVSIILSGNQSKESLTSE